MDQMQRGSDPSNLSALSSNQMPHVLFREIHKNAFLKKTSSDRRTGFPRRSERVWVVFCVHDDVEAFLEIYPDQKVAVTHKPDWFVSLSNALHVSPSICGHEDEFEFAVTLSTQVIRLAAPTWDSMMEWVEAIRSKLRELKILSPKENLYSKLPEPKQPLLPTRDPNSPLPLPPDGPSTLLPGVEPPIRLDPRAYERRHRHDETSQADSARDELTSRTRIGYSRTASVPEAAAGAAAPPPLPAPRTPIPSCSNITVIEVSCPRNSPTLPDDPAEAQACAIDEMFVGPSVSPKNVPESGASGAHYEHVFLPNTARNSTGHGGGVGEITSTDSATASSNVRVSAATSSGPSHSTSSSHNESNPSNNLSSKKVKEIVSLSQQIQSKLERISISGLIPRVSSRASRSRESKSKCDAKTSKTEPSSSSQVKKKGKVRGFRVLSPLTRRKKRTDAVSEPGPSTSGSSRSPMTAVEPGLSNSGVSRNQMPPVEPGPSNCGISRTHIPTFESGSSLPGCSRSHIPTVEPLNATVQPAVGMISVEDIPLIGGHQRRRRRSSSSDAATTSSNSNATRGINSGVDMIRVNMTDGENRDADSRSEEQLNIVANSSPRLTLREQQVLQLRREMTHPGGVRLQLRRKECLSSIALVDVVSCVWIAGWKQREHPMLYNALHIGDQLISVSDTAVRSAADAQKMIRTSHNIIVELIVRRVPFGRVFALQRGNDGQSLGIVQEGNTAEVKDVIADSIAARAGLAPKTATMDGLSLTNWALTEINGRPLNLFFKDTEIRDRLNAVGKEISILVQPNDFVKQLRKNLKSFRNYKDYIVQ